MVCSIAEKSKQGKKKKEIKIPNFNPREKKEEKILSLCLMQFN